MVRLNEKHMELILGRNPELIEPYLRLEQTQYRLKSKRFVDLICRDRADNYVLVELKTHLELFGVRQIIDYEKSMYKENIPRHINVRKILCCYSASKPAETYAKQCGIKIVKVNPETLVKTGSLNSYEIPSEVAQVIALLKNTNLSLSLQDIRNNVKFTDSTAKRTINFIKLFIPLKEELVDKEIYYSWPDHFEYELPRYLRKAYCS